MAGKQAKILSSKQIGVLLRHLDDTRYPLRNRAMLLLSCKAGLRAGEIAQLTWSMILDSAGEIGAFVVVPNAIAKKGSGRSIPMARSLKDTLSELHDAEFVSPHRHVIGSERGQNRSAASVVQWFCQLYVDVGFDGCSSHSGRRTFITNAARQISTVGGSLRDVQYLAGHSNLGMTARYIEASSDAMRKVVDLV